MIADDICDLNKWWIKKEYRNNVITRPFYENKITFKPSKLIKILIGPRRVGKTSIMLSKINTLLDSGIKAKNILFITSELLEIERASLSDVIKEYFTILKIDKKKNTYIFIDEVQDITNWQTVIKYYYDNFNIHFILSGSSSLLLVEESKKITGRFQLIEVLSLSLKEYVQFKKIKIPKTLTQKNSILKDYLYSGGYPEYVLSGSIFDLSNAIDGTLFRDLLSNYGIRNPKKIKSLLDQLTDKITNPVNLNSLIKQLQFNRETLTHYLEYLEAVYLIYPVYRMGNSFRITKGATPKYYFSDTGVLSHRSMNPKIGGLAENAFYLNLKRNALSMEDLGVYYVKNGINEIDFYDRRNDNYFEIKYRDNITHDEIDKIDDQAKLYRINVIVKNTEELNKNIYRKAYPQLEFYNLFDVLFDETMLMKKA